MKRLLSVFIALGTILGFSLVATAENNGDQGTGTVVIHFQAWDQDYEDLGSHTWGELGFEARLADGEDDFGAYWTYEDVPVGKEGTQGFIAVKYDETESPDWDAKKTEDVYIDASIVIADKTVHVYVFEGAETKEDEPQYLVSNPNSYNFLLIYYDPAGTYEEALGIHDWNDWDFEEGSTWGTPREVFEDVGRSGANIAVKGAMLHAANPGTDPGFLIYAGGDENKKTSNVKFNDAFKTTPSLGDVGHAYVASKGNAYTANDNVFYNDPEAFADLAFSFSIIPGNPLEETGTYAVNKTTLFVEISQQVVSPLFVDGEPVEGEAIDAAKAEVASWLKVFELEEPATETTPAVYGDELEIDHVDFAEGDETIGNFVVILKDSAPFDIEKNYEVVFDLGLEEDNLKDSIEILLDREAPIITFIGALEGKTAEERIIIVPWGKKYNDALFPNYIANDDRDGDVTVYVYVPKGEFSTLDTREVGDYVIMLRVEDKWGNVREEKFTFRVKKVK